MRKAFFVFSKLNVFLLFLVGSKCFFACKKEEIEEPKKLSYFLESTSTLIFEHSGVQQIELMVKCDESREFIVKISNLSFRFTPDHEEIVLKSNEKGVINLDFNDRLLGETPFECDISVVLKNSSDTPQTSKIHLYYKPNCAKFFERFSNVKLVNQNSPDTMDTALTFIYSNTGGLQIERLFTEPVFLDVNCKKYQFDDQHVTVDGKQYLVAGHFWFYPYQITFFENNSWVFQIIFK